MQYQVQSRPSRRCSQGNEVERFPKGGVRSRRQRGCASHRSRIYEHGACCSSHLRQNGSSAEDGTSSRRQRGVSHCGVTEISNKSPGKARMHTCLDQYNANKANNANGGLVWIKRGGGYYSECNKNLKG